MFSRKSPTYQTGFDRSKQKSSSLKRVDRKTVESGDPNVSSLISSVSCTGHDVTVAHIKGMSHTEDTSWFCDDMTGYVIVLCVTHT